MQKLYETQAHVTGGRDGQARSEDPPLSLDLRMPKALGGPGGGTNPEQLFAAGYGSCFESALRLVARTQGVKLPDGSGIRSTVTLSKDETSYVLGVRLEGHFPGLERGDPEGLMKAAHEVCPYSRATRGNIDVELAVA